MNLFISISTIWEVENYIGCFERKKKNTQMKEKYLLKYYIFKVQHKYVRKYMYINAYIICKE